MIATPQTKLYTAEDYLALEVKADTRSEYRNGEVVLMTGGTPEHNALSSALNALLWFGLRGKPYQVFVTDQRLAIPDTNHYTYPDVMVVPQPIALLPGRKDTVTQPVLIAEVLSQSTQAYDRTDKFEIYRSLPTFQEYLLIDQKRIHVEHHTQQGKNQWLFTKYRDRQAVIALSSVPVEIAIADLYENCDRRSL